MKEYPLQYASTDKNKKSHYSNVHIISKKYKMLVKYSNLKQKLAPQLA